MPLLRSPISKDTTAQNMVHQAEPSEAARAEAWIGKCYQLLEKIRESDNKRKSFVNRTVNYHSNRASNMIEIRLTEIRSIQEDTEAIQNLIEEMRNITDNLTAEDQERLTANECTLRRHIKSLTDYKIHIEGQIEFLRNSRQDQDLRGTIPRLQTPQLEESIGGFPSNQDTNINQGHPMIVQDNYRYRQTVKPVDIPKFDGNIKNWTNFWTLFNRLIHTANIQDIEKFNYLRQSLTGEAASLISSFSTDEESYHPAVSYLRSVYDHEDKILRYLMLDFIQLKAQSPSNKDLLLLMRKINGIARQTERNNEAALNALAIVLIQQKLPGHILQEVYRSGSNSNMNWRQLVDNTEKYLQHEQEVKNISSDLQTKPVPRTMHQSYNRQNFVTNNRPKPDNKKPSGKQTSNSCIFCQKPHAPWTCDTPKTRKERLTILNQDKRCINCLRKSHATEACPSKRLCSNCGGKHIDLLCLKKKTTKVNLTNSFPMEDEDEEEHVIQFSTQTKTNQYHSALLPIGQIELLHKDRTISIPALLDCGSDTSFIDEDLSKELELPIVESKRVKIKTFGNTASIERLNKVETMFKGHNSHILAQLWTKKVLTGPISTVRFSKPTNTCYKLNKNMKITPRILIGSDLMWQALISVEPLSKEHMVVHTQFGDFITGQATNQKSLNAHSVISEDLSISIPIWNKSFVEEQSEFTGTEAEEKTARDKLILDQFKETIQQKEDGYYVSFPWKDNAHLLPDNKVLALKRLTSLVLKLSQQPTLLEGYNKIIEEQLDLGIIEEAKDPYPNAYRIHYIAHQAVVTPQKETTKIRIVYDASGHYQNKPSLNDVIHQGPLILPSLIGMILRFRCGNTAMIADVQKAFLQIRLHESERDATRFFWLRDIHQPLSTDNTRTLRFCRVPFGINASPFLLGATIRHHLQKKSSESLLAHKIKDNLYVDNLLLASDSADQVRMWYSETKDIFQEMNMKLQEFISNDQIFNSNLTPEERNASTTPKILGLPWDTLSDQWIIQAQIPETKLTKRGVTQAIASIFDPMGMICPSLHPLRIFLQNLWTESFDWDTTLPMEIQTRWKQLCENFHINIRIPRPLPSDTNGQYHLVTCTDSSGNALGFCCYLIAASTRQLALIFAKSKLHSKNSTITIPKAEISALTIGVFNTLKIVKEIQDNIKILTATFLSDSEITLAWIRKKPDQKTTGVLVQNRIKEISNHIEELEDLDIKTSFGYIHTKDNPADLATRGCTTEELEDHFWWNPKAQLEKALNGPLFSLCDEEIRIHAATTETSDEEPWISDCSSWIEAQQKWISVHYPLTTTHTPSMYEEAETNLLHLHQNNLMVRLSAAQRNDLRPLLKNHLWYSRGRMNNAELEESAKLPIIILPKTKTARLLIEHVHGQLHKSTAHTMADIRQKYWIPQLRSQTQSVIRKCPDCQKMNNRPYIYPPSGDVPSRRIRKSRPFQHVGLDYFGPITTQDRNQKAWGCIYTCTVTRLIHLEVIEDLTTKSFLSCLRKIWARRGCPESITCDNASTFELGQKIANKLIVTATTNTSENQHRIKWYNITPYAPWQGGFYERLIRSVKNALYKTLHGTPSTEELSITLAECEATINTRPLTYIGSDTTRDEIIRPCDFIHKDIDLNIYIESEDEDSEYIDNPALQTQADTELALHSSRKRTNKFWELWSELYLKELRESHHHTISVKKAGTNTKPEIGQIVLINDSPIPRHKWPTGRITNIHPDSAGNIREVTLLSENGRELKRPVNLLHPMELSTDNIPQTLQKLETISPAVTQRQQNPRNLERKWYGETASILTLLTIFTIFLPTTMANPTISCNPKGVLIQGMNTDNQQVCSHNTCYNSSEGGLITLPLEDILSDYEVTWTFNHNSRLQYMTLNCPAVHFCSTVSCTFCSATLFNPSCWPWTSMLLFSFITYIITAICYGLLHSPWVIGKAIRLWTNFIYAICTSLFGQLYIRTNRFNKKTVIPLITLLLIHQSMACQELSMSTSQESSCNKETCKIQTGQSLTISPYTQEACLTFTNNQNKFSFLRIQWIKTTYFCEIRSLFFTRATSTHVKNSKRCARTGSCQENKCSTIQSDTMVHELELANQYPGSTHCTESCGGFGCGCFYPSSGCLFYRTYMKPIDKSVYEVFSCNEWIPSTQLHITYLNGTTTTSRNITLHSDIQTDVHPFKFSAISLTPPIIPRMQGQFIRNLTRLAIWNMKSTLTCSSHEKAKKLDCKANPQCECTPAEDSVNCHCENQNIQSVFNSVQTILPIFTPAYSIEQSQRNLEINIYRNMMAEIYVTVDGIFNVSSSHDDSTCLIHDSMVRGCYNCQNGAQANIICTSPINALAATNCGDTAFMLQCSPKGTSNNIRLPITTASPWINCSYSCGHNIQYFFLTGILYYVSNIQDLQKHYIEGNHSSLHETAITFQWPDITHFYNIYLGWYKEIAICILIVMLALAVSYHIIAAYATKFTVSSAHVIIHLVKIILWLPIAVTSFFARQLFLLYKRKTHILLVFILTIMSIPTTRCSDIQGVIDRSNHRCQKYIRLPLEKRTECLKELTRTMDSTLKLLFSLEENKETPTGKVNDVAANALIAYIKLKDFLSTAKTSYVFNMEKEKLRIFGNEKRLTDLVRNIQKDHLSSIDLKNMPYGFTKVQKERDPAPTTKSNIIVVEAMPELKRIDLTTRNIGEDLTTLTRTIMRSNNDDKGKEILDELRQIKDLLKQMVPKTIQPTLSKDTQTPPRKLRTKRTETDLPPAKQSRTSPSKDSTIEFQDIF